MKHNKVKVIYLEDYDGKAERYVYMEDKELRDVLKEALLIRNIWIGENFKFGDYLFIGYNTVIGHNVTIGSCIYIDCHSNIGNNVILEDNIRINNESIIKDNTKIKSYNMFTK